LECEVNWKVINFIGKIKMSNLNTVNKPSESNDSNGSVLQEKPRQGWVKFDEETQGGRTSNSLNEPNVVTSELSKPSTSDVSGGAPPAVIKTETVHVNLDRGDRIAEANTQPTLTKNVEFVNVRHGFSKY
jgi:hypothetical protein